MPNKTKKIRWPRHAVYVYPPTVELKKLGPMEARALPIMRELWPPHGVPPGGLSQKEALAQVNLIFKSKHGRELSRPSFIRIVKKLSDGKL